MLVFDIVIEDKLINPVAGVSIPIIFEISMKGGMTIPLKSPRWTMAHLKYHVFFRGILRTEFFQPI